MANSTHGPTDGGERNRFEVVARMVIAAQQYDPLLTALDLFSAPLL